MVFFSAESILVPLRRFQQSVTSAGAAEEVTERPTKRAHMDDDFDIYGEENFQHKGLKITYVLGKRNLDVVFAVL